MSGASRVGPTPPENELAEPDPPGRWSALVRLAVGMVLAMTTWFSASAVLPQLRVEWDLSTTAGSWLTIAVQLGFVVGALSSAVLNLADLVPPRRLMLYGALGAATANLLLLFVDGPVLAIPLRFLTGAFLAGVYPPGLKSMATWFRRGRGTALGVMVGALTLGSAMPHLVNGLGGVEWERVIVATSVLTVAGGHAVHVPAAPPPDAAAVAAVASNRPAGHGAHAVRAASGTEPSPHGSHAALPSPDAYVSASHAVHAAPSPPARPSGHAVQNTLPAATLDNPVPPARCGLHMSKSDGGARARARVCVCMRASVHFRGCESVAT